MDASQRLSERKFRVSRVAAGVVGIGIYMLAYSTVRLHLRAPQTPIAPASTPPSRDQPAPDFTLNDIKGRQHTLSSHRGRYVLVSFFCGCLPCKQLNQAWSALHRERADLDVLAVTSMGQADAQHYAVQEHLSFPILLDAYAGTSRQWQSLDCPRSWLIAPSGNILFYSVPGTSPVDIARAVRRQLDAASRG